LHFAIPQLVLDELYEFDVVPEEFAELVYFVVGFGVAAVADVVGIQLVVVVAADEEHVVVAVVVVVVVVVTVVAVAVAAAVLAAAVGIELAVAHTWSVGFDQMNLRKGVLNYYFVEIQYEMKLGAGSLSLAVERERKFAMVLSH